MRFCLLILSLLAAPSFAAISNLTVLGTTATQAVLSYDAPDLNPCTFQVSQGGTLGALVHDVDPALFTGANQDVRPGSLVTGTHRTVVIGARVSQLATAGPYAGMRHYSRALQLNTLHTFQVTCDTFTAATTFTTTNIFPGDTYPEPWFQDSANPGDQPFPEALGDQSGWSFIDPLTGMYMQEVSTRGDVSAFWFYPPSSPIISAHNAGQLPCDAAGPWTSPCYAVAAQGSYSPPPPAGYATVGNSTAWLVLPIDMNQGIFGGLYGGTTYDYGDVLDQAQFTLTGYVTSADPNLRQIDVCLSMNAGASCASQILTMTLPQGSPGTPESVGQADPTRFGVIPWLMDSNPRINRPEFQAHRGQVTVSGSTLTWAGGDPFSTYWFTGGAGNIWLASTSQNDACNFAAFMPNANATRYNLVSLVDGNHITVSGTPSAGTYYYCTHNSAVMIRRHTADGNSTANVQSAYLTAVAHSPYGTTANGESTACYDTLVSGGFFCNIGGLFWVNPNTAATSWFGAPQLHAKTSGANQWGNKGNCPSIQAAWDETQPVPTWYCVITDSAGKLAFIMGQYTGSTTPPAQPRQLNGQINNLTVSATDDYSVTYGGGALVFTDLTPSSLGQSISDQMAQFDPTFVAAKFTSCPGPSGLIVQQGIALFSCQSQGQDTPAWELAVSAGDGVPAHAGATGAHIVGAVNSFSGPMVRWRGTHAIDDLGEQPYFSFGANPYGQMMVTTSVAIPSTGTDCGTYGGTVGQSCSVIQIDQYQGSSYEPYLQNYAAPFTGAPGELGAAAPGDTARFGSTSGELMTLVAKNYGGVQGQWVWQRSSNPQALPGTGQKTIYFQPSVLGTEKWNPVTDPHGLNPLTDPEELSSHGYWRDGVAVEGAVIGSLTCTNPLFTAYQVRVGSYPGLTAAPLNFVNGNPFFGGACFGAALPNDSQSHPNPAGALASAKDRMQAFDVRPQLGESQAPQAGTFANVTGQLYSYTTTAADPDDLNLPTQFTGLTGVLNRKLVSTAASCGAHPLLDVSGPVSAIDGTAANSYKYCIPRVSGECYPGSTLGQIYVNCPNVITTGCSGNGVHGGTVMGMGNDICVYNGSAPDQMAVQFGVAANDGGAALTRNLTTSIGRLRMTSGFANARLLPDNSWILLLGDWLNLNGHDLWMGQMPPWDLDSVSRSNFLPLMLSLDPPPGAKVNNAIVEFGYGEDGAPAALNCTTRNDVCVASAASVGAPPYHFLSENPSGAPCASGCSVAIPAVPQRVLYYRVFYRDASNNILSGTPIQAITSP